MTEESGGARHELRVLQGLHAGAALPLERGQITIGADESCDVVLLDAGVLPEHLRLKWVDGRWVAGDGQTEVALGMAIPVGAASIALCDATRPWTMPAPPGLAAESGKQGAVHARAHRRVTRRWRLWVMAFALLALLPGLALLALALPDTTSAAKAAAEARPVTVQPVRTPSPASAADLEQLTREVLASRELREYVSVQTLAGQIQLKAELDDDQVPNFESALQALKRRIGDRAHLQATLVPLAQTLPFQIREVVMGPVSYITIADGRRLSEGASIMGVRLVAIRPGKLVFAGKHRVELAW